MFFCSLTTLTPFIAFISFRVSSFDPLSTINISYLYFVLRLLMDLIAFTAVFPSLWDRITKLTSVFIFKFLSKLLYALLERIIWLKAENFIEIRIVCKSYVFLPLELRQASYFYLFAKHFRHPFHCIFYAHVFKRQIAHNIRFF